MKMRHDADRTVTEDNRDVGFGSKYFDQCTTKKTKRFRSAFTTDQIFFLEREFNKFPYIGSASRKEVANKLKISERAIKIWFQNRRMKEKKEVTIKDYDMEHLSEDFTKFTNDQLGVARNWQSNNDRCPNEQNDSGSNVPKDLIAQTTTDSSKLHEKLSTLKIKKEVSAANLCHSASVATKNVHQVPMALHKVKTEPTLPTVKLSKENNVPKAPSKQNKSPRRRCAVNKNYLNDKRDVPQDLSSRGIICNLYSQQPHYIPVNPVPDPRFIPLHMQTSYTPPSLSPGNVVWKPVNVLSALPGLSPPSVSMNMPHNHPGVNLLNHNIKNKCSCSCNCHNTYLRGFNHVDTRMQPQYLIAAPFSNSK